MVASPRVENLKHLPTIGGVVAGLGGAAAIALIPAASLESLIWQSGIVSLIPAAEPPIGVTMRFAFAAGAGVIAAAVVWSVLYLLFGPGGLLSRRRAPGMPAVRRADAHPDAPPRRPLFAAADLGTPLMDICAAPSERPLPRDLDLPLAAFDPQAVPDAPRAPVRPVASLAPRPQLIDPGDRIETFELTPVVRPTAPQAKPSIETLLRRLEQGARLRQPASSPREGAGSVRRMAS